MKIIITADVTDIVTREIEVDTPPSSLRELEELFFSQGYSLSSDEKQELNLSISPFDWEKVE